MNDPALMERDPTTEGDLTGREIDVLQKDRKLYYHFDYEEHELLKNIVANAQAHIGSQWSDDFEFPPVTFFQRASENVYQTTKTIKIDEDWHLLLSAEGKVLWSKAFFGQLFFNPKKRQLLLVFKGTTVTRVGNLISDISNVFLNKGGGEVNSAFTFAERVRQLISQFKEKPQLFITGHSLGGFLAQVATYTIRNCCLDKRGKVRKQQTSQEAEFGVNTVVFDAPAAFKQILRIAKAIEDPLTDRCVNLPIANFLCDVNLINCNSKIGPHVGMVIKLQKNNHLSNPSTWKRLKKVSVHGINNFNAIGDLEDVDRMIHLLSNEAVNYDASLISLIFFTEQEQEALYRIPFLISIQTSRNHFLPNYALIKKSVKIFNTNVSPDSFIPKLRFYVSKNRDEISNSAQLVENEIAKTLADLMQALSNEVDDLDFELNEIIVNGMRSLPSGSRIGGLETDQSQTLFARLLCNSTPDCYCINFSDFMKQDRTRREKWLSLFTGTLVLILAEGKSVGSVSSQSTRLLYVDNEITAQGFLQLPLTMSDLNEKSKIKFLNHRINFFGNEVKTEMVFLSDVTQLKLCDMLQATFTLSSEETRDFFYFPQPICSNTDVQFESAEAIGKDLHEKVTLLSCSAGMGKSTSLRRIAKSLRQEHPNYWIALLDLTKIQFSIPNERRLIDQKELALASVREFCLTDADSNNKMLNRVFDLKAKAFEMIVLLDSFDEACPLHRTSALKLMELLKTCGVKMLVATRPQEEDQIIKTLHCQRKKVLRLQPLSSSAQTQFLAKFIAYSQGANVTAKIIKYRFKALVKKARLKSNVWGIPLNLVMAIELLDREGMSSDMNGDLYKFFIEKSISKTLEDKLSMSPKNASQQHSLHRETLLYRCLLYKMAVNLLFNDGKCIDELGEYEQDFFNRFPLATVLGKRVIFMHKTYAEYLLADLMVKLMYQQMQSDALTKEQCLQILVEAEFEGVQKFMDKILSYTELQKGKKMKKVYSDDVRVIEAMLGDYIVSDLYYLYKALSDLEDITSKQMNRKQLVGGVLKIPFIQALEHSTKRQFLELLQQMNRKQQVEGVLKSPFIQTLEHSTKQQFLELLLQQGAEIGANSLDCPFIQDTPRFFTELSDEYSLITPLMHVAILGLCDMASFLIEKGASVNFVCPGTGETALMYATKHGRKAMVELLLKHGGSVTASEFCAAAENNLIKMVRSCCDLNLLPVDSRNRLNRTALMEASDKDHASVAKLLISKGADPLASDNDGWTSLHFAARSESATTMRLLLEHTDNVDPRNKTGKTPLHIAVQHGTVKIVKILVESRADHAAADDDGWTVLHFAAKSKPKSKNIFHYLIQLQEHNLNQETHDGKTPLHVAVSEGNKKMAQMLMKNIAADGSVHNFNGHLTLTLSRVKFFYPPTNATQKCMSASAGLVTNPTSGNDLP